MFVTTGKTEESIFEKWGGGASPRKWSFRFNTMGSILWFKKYLVQLEKPGTTGKSSIFEKRGG